MRPDRGVRLTIAVGRKPLRRGNFDAALWTGLVIYTLLIAGRRTFLNLNAMAAIWPAAGVMAATFLLTPRRNWKWILLVVVTESVVLNDTFGFSPRTLISIPEGMLLAFMIRKTCPPSLNFADPRTLTRFVLAAAAPACLTSALACYVLPNAGAAHTSWNAAIGWFTGHMLGATIAVPTMVTLLRPRRYSVFDRPAWELLLASGAMMAYAGMLLHAHSVVLLLLVFPMSMFVAFRYGPIGAAAVSALMTALALLHIYAGLPGPRPDTPVQVQWVQTLVAVVFITSLPAAGALASLQRTRRLLARRTEIACQPGRPGR